MDRVLNKKPEVVDLQKCQGLCDFKVIHQWHDFSIIECVNCKTRIKVPSI